VLRSSPFKPIGTAVFALLLMLVCVNALLYAAKAANPLVASDSWHFVDTLLREVIEGQFSIGDLFAKRSPFDHSQPLRKLIMLFHYRYFDLDFGIEAIIGVLVAFMNLALFWWIALASRKSVDGGSWRVRLLFLALSAVYLSLNSGVVFNWSLLTLSYTSHTFILVFLASAWWAYQAPVPARLAALFAAALLMNVVADDTGLVASVAALLAASLWGFRDRRWATVAKVVVGIILAFVAYRLFYVWVTHGSGTAAAHAMPSAASRLSALIAHGADLKQASIVPLTASVAHRMQLRALLGANTVGAELAIALLLVAAHLWFWWRAVTGKRNIATFVAVSLMLVFYGLIAGMLLVRVSTHGMNYLWQPRYVLIYEWNVIALLLMALAQRPAPEDTDAPRMDFGFRAQSWVAALVAAMLLLWQVPLSLYTWHSLKYVSAYQQHMALQLGAVAENPAVKPANCVPMLTICKFDPRRRTAVLRLLRKHHLNLFSPAFRDRNRLYLSNEDVSR